MHTRSRHFAWLLAALPFVAGSTERVWHTLPDDYRLSYHKVDEGLAIRGWSPAHEPERERTRVISVQTFPVVHVGAADMAARFATAAAEQCQGTHRATRLHAGFEHGADVLTQELACRQSGGELIVSVQKFLVGADATHVVSVDFEKTPSDEVLRETLPHLIAARLCDDRDPVRTCPEGGVAPLFVYRIDTGRPEAAPASE